MNNKIIATIVIIAMFAGFASIVAQMSQQASATATLCFNKGSKQQCAAVCSEGDCKRIFTPSHKVNTNSKC
ncbi:MAG TPA: hypothetical protein VJP58_10050 [Candidatus Nitrosocosmicus sp.]|nr:hypothetical protein [Candidatus Nitrosocosmicus sp.]